MLDRIFMGVGTARGRRSSSNLRINDVIDFFRVEDLKHNKRLLLRAEMKLPGRAWLEFNLNREEDENRLSVKTYYQHRGLFGKIYWYLFLPFHNVIFKDLIGAAIAVAAMSLLLSLEFYILQAPDVAIAEAGVGACLTTAILVIAIRATKRQEEA